MKTIFSLLVTTSLFFFSSCISMKPVEGDGNLVAEKINISDYDEIEISNGPLKVNYTQSVEAPFLEVTTDQNIYDMFEFIVKDGNKLSIRPKKEHRRGHNFRPTQFTVTTNSSKLKKADLAGYADFNVNGPLLSDKLELQLAGSGTIHLNDSTTVGEVDVDLAGSGTLIASALFCATFDADIAGSGTLKLAGTAKQASLDIAGSGKMKAYDFVVTDLKCNIAGSGDVEITANGTIDSKVAGSGTVRYKGNPSNIIKKNFGSGSVEKVD